MTELRFVSPDLRQLDQASAEVVTCGIFRDQRPLTGLAGLLDWRLAGRLSRLLRENFVLGDAGEALIVPIRSRLPFDKVIAFGLGPRNAFDEGTYRTVLERTFDTLAGLSAKKALVELPGRGDGAIPPERAAEVLLELLARSGSDHDAESVVFVEDPEGQKRIETHASETRRGPTRTL